MQQLLLILCIALGSLSLAAQPYSLSGRITMPAGGGYPGLPVHLSDDAGKVLQIAETNEAGAYAFTGLNSTGAYTVRPVIEPTAPYLAGVSTFDIVAIQRFLLGHPTAGLLQDPYSIIAADVDFSGRITAFDLLLMARLILAVDTAFPAAPPWRFVRADAAWSDPLRPLSEVSANEQVRLTLDGDRSGVDFIAVKVGDVNFSAE